MFAKFLPLDARVKKYRLVVLFQLVWPAPEVSGIHALLCHLVLFGLAQSKHSEPAQTCNWQAQAELDGATVRVYPAPYACAQ